MTTPLPPIPGWEYHHDDLAPIYRRTVGTQTAVFGPTVTGKWVWAYHGEPEADAGIVETIQLALDECMARLDFEFVPTPWCPTPEDWMRDSDYYEFEGEWWYRDVAGWRTGPYDPLETWGVATDGGLQWMLDAAEAVETALDGRDRPTP